MILTAFDVIVRSGATAEPLSLCSWPGGGALGTGSMRGYGHARERAGTNSTTVALWVRVLFGCPLPSKARAYTHLQQHAEDVPADD